MSASLRDSVFVSFGGGRFEPSARLVSALEDPEFARQLRAVVDFGLGRWRGDYSDTFDGTCLVLNEKYTYEDVCRLLGWGQNVNGQNIGGYKYDAGTNTFPVFINYEKDDSVSDSIRYEDRFLSPKELVAISKQPRHMQRSSGIGKARQQPIDHARGGAGARGHHEGRLYGRVRAAQRDIDW